MKQRVRIEGEGERLPYGTHTLPEEFWTAGVHRRPLDADGQPISLTAGRRARHTKK